MNQNTRFFMIPHLRDDLLHPKSNLTATSHEHNRYVVSTERSLSTQTQILAPSIKDIVVVNVLLLPGKYTQNKIVVTSDYKIKVLYSL